MSDVEDIWPGWRVEAELGRGSFGTVYRASRTEMGHTSVAAVKVIGIPQSAGEARELAASGMDEASIRDYFGAQARGVVDEIALMESLKGAPNVVAIEDYRLVERGGEPGWTVFIRMELVEPLADRFARVGQPDAREAARLGADVCSALAYCHARGVVHRDVKPENVFWSPYGYKLGDFGIARELDRGSGLASTVAGSATYMAPEVAGGGRYDERVDVYSLGVMLYRYLNAGRFPFLPASGAFTPADLDAANGRRMGGEPVPAPRDADPALAAIVCRACAPDPADRWPSAAAMRDALEGWLRGGGGNQFMPVPVPTICISDGASDEAESVSAAGNVDDTPTVAVRVSGTRIVAANSNAVASKVQGNSTRAFNRPRWLVSAAIVAGASIALIVVFIAFGVNFFEFGGGAPSSDAGGQNWAGIVTSDESDSVAASGVQDPVVVDAIFKASDFSNYAGTIVAKFKNPNDVGVWFRAHYLGKNANGVAILDYSDEYFHWLGPGDVLGLVRDYHPSNYNNYNRTEDLGSLMVTFEYAKADNPENTVFARSGDGLEVSAANVQSDFYGFAELAGTVTNTSEYEYTSVDAYALLYDEAGALVDGGLCAFEKSDIEAGGVEEFALWVNTVAEYAGSSEISYPYYSEGQTKVEFYVEGHPQLK